MNPVGASSSRSRRVLNSVPTNEVETQGLRPRLTNTLMEDPNQIASKRTAEASTESDVPRQPQQEVRVRRAEYFSLPLQRINAVAENAKQRLAVKDRHSKFLEEENEALRQRIEEINERNAMQAEKIKEAEEIQEKNVNEFKKMANEFKEVTLNFLKTLSNNAELSIAGIRLLINILENKYQNYEVMDRVSAAYRLGKHSPLSPEVHSALEAALQDKEGKVKLQAAITLGCHNLFPTISKQILLDAVKNTNGDYEAEQRFRALLLLNQFRPLLPEIRPVLEAALQDTEEKIKLEAAITLGCHHIFSATSRKILLSAVKNPHVDYQPGQRANAILVLGQHQPLLSEIRLALEAALQNNDEGAKFQVAIALGLHNIFSTTSIEILLDAVKNTNGDYEPGQRFRAVMLLGQCRPLLPEIRSALEAALQDKDEGVKVQAAVALYHDDLLFNICRDILLGAVKNKEVEYEAGQRASAALALGQHQPLLPEARSVLEAALQDEDKGVRVGAARALDLKGLLPDAGRQTLLDAVENKEGEYEVAHRVSATMGLGRQLAELVKTQSALRAALQDEDERVRDAAATALNFNSLLPDTGRPQRHKKQRTSS